MQEHDLNGTPNTAARKLPLPSGPDRKAGRSCLANPLVLQVSDDMNLGNSRQQILEYFGARVITVSSRELTREHLDKQPDVLLLCQSVSDSRAEIILHLAAASGHSSRTLRITPTVREHLSNYDLLLLSPVVPESLAKAIRSLARGTQAA